MSPDHYLVSSATSTTPSIIPSITTEHLGNQIKIVSALYQEQRSNLSKLEQAWISNTISLANQTVTTCLVHQDGPSNSHRLYQKLPSLHTLASRVRSSQSQTTSLTSQCLMSTQNLNSVINLLSWRASTTQEPAVNASTEACHTGEQDILETELSKFLNRGRVGRRNPTEAGSQPHHPRRQQLESTVFELGGTRSLLRDANHSTSELEQKRLLTSEGTLPFTLVETVEIWRQNAEEALKAAMRDYFEREELLKSMVENKISDEAVTMDGKTSASDTPCTQTDTRQKLDITTQCPANCKFHGPAVSSSQLGSSHVQPRTTIRRKPAPPSSPTPTASLLSSTATPSTTATSHGQIMSPRQPSDSSETQQGIVDPKENKLEISSSDLTTPTTAKTSTKIITPYHSTSPLKQSQSHVSIQSLTSNINQHQTSFDLHGRSMTSFSSVPPENTYLIPLWQQPESQSRISLSSSGDNTKKSRGRRWLERQVAARAD